MFLLALLITASVAVIAQDLLGVSSHYDSQFLNSFTEEKCVNTTRWQLVNYNHLEIAPPYDTSFTAIRASNNSCVSSFPMAFVNGTLEATVYLRTISKNSGITISVFDEDYNKIIAVKYHRINKNFVTGWTTIYIPIIKRGSGYVQLSGQSLSSEYVIIDSLRYTPDIKTTFLNKAPLSTVLLSPPEQFRSLEDDIEDELFIVNFNEVDDRGDGEEDIEGSGGNFETEAPATEELDTPTEEPESAEVIQNPDEPGFWNAFTITIVSVGAFVVVGSVGVGTFYLGKNAGVSAIPLQDLEALETPRQIIPRVRNVYTDERFSRFS